MSIDDILLDKIILDEIHSDKITLEDIIGSDISIKSLKRKTKHQRRWQFNQRVKRAF